MTPGDGYRKCMPLDILANWRTAAGVVMSGSSTPPIAALESNFLGIAVAASTTFMGLFNWVVPDDYDPSADELRIRTLCNMAGNTNATVTITPTIYRKRPNLYTPTLYGSTNYASNGTGVALSADLGCPVSAVYIPTLASPATDLVPSVSNDATRWVELNCDYRKADHSLGTYSTNGGTTGAANRTLAATADATLKPGDVIQVTLTASAHTTDAINVYGLEIWYRSNLAFTEINNR